MLNRFLMLSSAAAIAATLSLPALAQGAPQTLEMMKAVPASQTTGYRTSKVVGSTVYNDANVEVGTIDDLIVTPADKVTYAVLSIGGFLGIGTRLAVVPIDALEVKDKRMVMHGATKASLMALLPFSYAS